MPSETLDRTDELAQKALASLKTRVDAFHSVVADAEEELRTYTTHQRGHTQFRGEQALVELGPFAVGRVDAGRFAALLGEADALTPQAEDALDRATVVFEGFAEASSELFQVVVPPGGDLRNAVKDALLHAGQVFGASRAVEMARAGIFDPAKHNPLLGALAFRRWNRAERHLAPPLVVRVEADDFFPAGLGEFLDGEVKMVVIVEGLTTPAPLARLVTPGTFVMQTADPKDLEKLAASPHPGIALLFEEEKDTQARFVHDPDAGDAPWERLTIQHLPDDPAVGRGRRAPTWLEDVEHLKALAARPPAAPTAGELPGKAAEQPTSADHLAAWLLTQTDLSGL